MFLTQMPWLKRLGAVCLMSIVAVACNLGYAIKATALPEDVTLLYEGESGFLNGIAFSGDGLYAAISEYTPSSDSSRIRLLDMGTKTNSVLLQTEDFGGELQVLEWSADTGELLVWSSADFEIWVINPLGGTTIPVPLTIGTSAIFTPDGNLVVLRSNPLADRYDLYLHNRSNGEESLLFSESRPVTNIRWIPGTRQITFLRHSGMIYEPGELYIFEIERLSSMPMGDPTSTMEFDVSPNGELLAIAVGGASPNLESSTLGVVTIDGQCMQTFVDLGSVTTSKWLPNGSALAYMQGNNVFVIDLSSRLVMDELTIDTLCGSE